MFSKALHNRWARLGMGILGVLLMAISINLFVVPHNLYTGGLLGFCQLFRSVLTQELGVDPGFDISGALYLLLNPKYVIFIVRFPTFVAEADMPRICVSAPTPGIILVPTDIYDPNISFFL